MSQSDSDEASSENRNWLLIVFNVTVNEIALVVSQCALEYWSTVKSNSLEVSGKARTISDNILFASTCIFSFL